MNVIKLSSHWSDSEKEQDEAEQLQVELDKIIETLSEDQKLVIKKVMEHEFRVGQDDIRDEYEVY